MLRLQIKSDFPSLLHRISGVFHLNDPHLLIGIVLMESEYYTLNVRSRGKQLVLFSRES